MVGYLPHCTFNLNPRAASIDTPLHGFLPYAHVDHMHPDAVIAIAASKTSRALTKEIYGDSIGWLPWRRPGFELGLMLEKFARAHPEAVGVVLESHGLFTWGQDGRACYETTIATINKAIAWLAGKEATLGPVFGGAATTAEEPATRRATAARLMVAIRGEIGRRESKVGHFDDDPAVLEFVNAKRLGDLAALGTSCPDHFLRTKIRPLVVDHAGDVAGDARRPWRCDRRIPRGLCRLLRALPARRQPGHARSQSGGLSGAARRHDHLCPRQGDGAHRRRVLPQRHQRHARRLDRRHLCRPGGAGGFRHRVLASGRGQAAAHAQARRALPAASRW